MKNFALIGAAGYIAPKHMRAIKQTGNTLLTALDKNDSVGIIDEYFPNSTFFTEFERFDRHIEKIKRNNEKIHYLSICSPNYLHDAHIRFGLRHGADVICEKPLVLNPWNVENLKELEKETGKSVYNILQLRLHPSILNLKQRVEEAEPDKVFNVDLTYQTSRGNWYYTSWKGHESKSGGIATNIGIHFFDMLIWIFGPVKKSTLNIYEHDRASGVLELERANIKWFLSINFDLLPETVKASNSRSFRSITIDNSAIEFTDGFTDLHTESYKQIFKGNGFKIEETFDAIQLVHDIRNSPVIGLKGDYHPFANLKIAKHPFNNR
jgi:UDP-N-acetyl-2-amino-2-deoxyglucuronate dehydrogenase